jgi:SAM-dependent methyltransferase
MLKDLIIRGIKRPHRIIPYLWYKLRVSYNNYIRKRVPFTYEGVVGGWGVKGAGLPHFSARLYKEVKLLNDAIGGYHAKRSLEIGCGYGRLTPWLTEHSDHHYAIEPESVLLNDAKKLYPDVRFHHAKAQKLPFPDNYFDLCVTWTVLQHIPPKELAKAVAEIKRVGTSDAVIILAELVEGKGEGSRTWPHVLEEWKNRFSPWKLSWCKKRIVEETNKGESGLVMRFEND